MVIKNWKVRPFVVLLKKHEKLCFRFRFVFFFYLVFVFPSFWWSGGGYGSATVTGRFIFLVKTPQWHWIALMSKLFFVFFLFFVAVVCLFVFLRSILNIHTKRFFFHSIFLIIDFDLKLLSSLTCTTMIFRAGAGSRSSWFFFVVAKTKHAALFFSFNL